MSPKRYTIADVAVPPRKKRYTIADVAPQEQAAPTEDSGQSIKTNISKAARPTLEMVGAVGGGAIGASAAGPVGAAAGGTLGYAAGSGLADRVDELLGLKNAPLSFSEGVGDTAAALKRGAMIELGGKLLENGISSQVVDKVLAKMAGAIGRVQSGVRIAAGERLFRDPGAIFSGARQKAGEILGQTRKSLGFEDTRALSEKVADIGDKGMGEAIDTLKNIENNVAQAPEKIIRGIQAFSRKVEETPIAQRQARALFGDAKHALVDRLASLSGGLEERAAAKAFSRSALADEFRNILPVTKSGDISVGRSSFLPAMIVRNLSPESLVKGIGIVALQSPLLAGVEIAGAGGLAKAARIIFGNPELRRSLMSILSGLQENENSR